jgi:hypothetical protein
VDSVKEEIMKSYENMKFVIENKEKDVCSCGSYDTLIFKRSCFIAFCKSCGRMKWIT